MRSFQDVGKGTTLDRTVGRNGNLEDFVWRVLLKTDVASTLAHNDKPRSLERVNNFKVGETWDDAQTVISVSCLELVRMSSSSTGSK